MSKRRKRYLHQARKRGSKLFGCLCWYCCGKLPRSWKGASASDMRRAGEAPTPEPDSPLPRS